MTHVHEWLLTGFRILSLTLCAIWFGNSPPSSATELTDRFLELSNDGDVTTYDLTTVQIILPGKFTVIGTTIDNPDVMKLELTALDTLRSYCGKPDGTYSPPDALFTLGKPDMPVANITVKSGQTKIGEKSYAFKKCLAATNAVPSGLKGSLGIELRKAVEEGSPSNLSRIGDLIGGFFGGFTKSIGSG